MTSCICVKSRGFARRSGRLPATSDVCSVEKTETLIRNEVPPSVGGKPRPQPELCEREREENHMRSKSAIVMARWAMLAAVFLSMPALAQSRRPSKVVVPSDGLRTIQQGIDAVAAGGT